MRFLLQKAISKRSLGTESAAYLDIGFSMLEIAKSRLYSCSGKLLLSAIFKMSTDISVTETHPDLRGTSLRTGNSGSHNFRQDLSRDRQLAVALFLLSFGYLWIFRGYTSMEPDEGIVLQGAQRILRGEVLYRDFFSFFTPGSYYLQALISRIFGSSFLVARTTLVLFGAAFSVLSYLLARRACSRGTAFTIAVLTAATTLPYRFLVLHNWDSTLWAMLALYGAVRWLESGAWAWAFATSSFGGLTLMFEQSKGTGVYLGLLAGFLAIRSTRRKPWKLQPSALLLGFSWPVLAVVVYFATHHSLSAMLADWLWPFQHYSTANRVPYGYQNWSDTARQEMFGGSSILVRILTVLIVSPCLLMPVLPLLAVGMLVYWIRRADPEKSAYYILTCSVICGLLLSVVFVRADVIHFMYLAPIFMLVLAWIADGRDISGTTFKAARPFLNAFVLAIFALFAMALLVRTVSASNQTTTRRGTIVTPEKDTVVDYVQAHVPANETILVYPYLPLYYYLTQTFSPSRNEYFQPGMNTNDQAQEIVAALENRHVQYVVFESAFAEKIPNAWPQTPIRDIVHDRIADYILKNYRLCATLRSPNDWRFLFMARKDRACP
jgi:4-amino-4-deoxy-L-arabinose transferase-like glycosyltransferase